MAAAAAIQSIIPRHLPGSSKRTKPAEDVPRAPYNHEEQEREKHFVAQMTALVEPLPPKEIARDSKHKQLGGSSHQLSLEDFELIKTLGTGIYSCYSLLNSSREAE